MKRSEIRHNIKSNSMFLKMAVLLFLVAAAAILMPSCNPVLSLNPRYSYTSFELDLGDTIPYDLDEYIDFGSMSEEDSAFVRENAEILYDGEPADERFLSESGEHYVTIMYCGHQYRKYQVNITDKEPPVIKVLRNITTFQGIDPGTFDPESLFSVSDNSGKCNVKISQDEVDFNTAGKYAVTCTATDKAGNTTEEKAYVLVQEPAYGAEGTYVFISIADQHLTYFVDSKPVLDCPVVTGNTAGHNTPRGTFSLLNKARNLTLRGREDDGSKYASFVSYWMAFLGSSYGMHDATWRSSFGGNIYQGRGSHGCVNMPYASAAALYEQIEIGTPVLIY